MSHKLLVKDQQGEREVLLIDTVAVGRDPRCDISLADPLLSRRHAEFVASGEIVIVRDLNSRNGILVNGRRLPEAVLRPGDVVQIAQLAVTFLSSVDAMAMAVPRPVQASLDYEAVPSGAAMQNTASETSEDKTAVLTQAEIEAVAVASAARRSASSETGGGAPTNGASRPGAWSVQVVADDDRTKFVPPPAAPLADGLNAQPASPPPTVDAPAAAPDAPSGTVVCDPHAVVTARQAAERIPEGAAAPAPRPSMTSGLAAGIVALAILCFTVGVTSTMIWLQPPLTARWILVDHVPVAVVVSFVLAVGAGVGLVVAVRRTAQRV